MQFAATASRASFRVGMWEVVATAGQYMPSIAASISTLFLNGWHQQLPGGLFS